MGIKKTKNSKKKEKNLREWGYRYYKSTTANGPDSWSWDKLESPKVNFWGGGDLQR